ncbi:MAG: alpha-L-arabinofuranosidase C-terminal domain-containing protein [Thermoguttaceae bacterium]|jgi:alpha-L-arabinofuranosidase
MNSRFIIIAVALAQFAFTIFSIQAQTPAAGAGPSLSVQVDKPGINVSPMLYGIFFEEINHAGDGGLYAELVQNRSFENSEKPDCWTLVTDGSAKGEMAIDTENPMGENNPRSLRLKIEGGGKGKVGVSNKGYWGIAVVKGEQYDLSVAIRAGDGFTGPVSVSLERANGKKNYAQARINKVDSLWKIYKLTLTSNTTDPEAQLVLSVSHPGTLWMDMVSLFPHKTFKDRPNGMRLDLAMMLENLHPAFMRFPGGCWVEGETLDTAMRWKRTIGDPAQRRNQWNLWQYYSTNGLGFHEYLQLCEDLGAEPLFVINCGMSHKEQQEQPNGTEGVEEYVQDALDAIEYATGLAESKWGALRAKAGHPAPFSLKYMEIGNENGGPAYYARYAMFYDAIKAKYPQMKLIANDWNGRPTNRPVEIIDEHYYSNPEFFISNANKYDTYDRKGAKVYVGEYAVTENIGRGNLRGAVGEAAFMTGMERNSDVVVMASYAPLFVNINDRRWNPDLIQFDSLRVWSTPSYYVQQMFSQNRGDVILPLKLEFPAASAEGKHGAIGLGAWMTQAEYTDIKIAKGDKTLFADDFSSGSDSWKIIHGQWQVEDGAFQQTSNESDCFATAGDPSWSDYTLTLKARKLGGNEGFLIIFNAQPDNQLMWWNIGGWGNTKHALERRTGFGNVPFGNDFPGSIATDRWYDIRVEVGGQSVRCYLDGKLIHDVKYPVTCPLYGVAGLGKSGNEVILKVVNVSNVAQETDIHLAGADKVQPTGTAIVFSSEKSTDDNTLDNPKKVAPVTRQFQNAANDFKHTFPADSVSVLRLKIK